MSILIDEVKAWTRKYERLRELLTAELGLADIHDIRAAEARGYQRAIADLRDVDKYRSWLDTADREADEPWIKRHADYLDAQTPTTERP